jgi:hypothetical protein
MVIIERSHFSFSTIMPINRLSSTGLQRTQSQTNLAQPAPTRSTAGMPRSQSFSGPLTTLNTSKPTGKAMFAQSGGKTNVQVPEAQHGAYHLPSSSKAGPAAPANIGHAAETELAKHGINMKVDSPEAQHGAYHLLRLHGVPVKDALKMAGRNLPPPPVTPFYNTPGLDQFAHYHKEGLNLPDTAEYLNINDKELVQKMGEKMSGWATPGKSEDGVSPHMGLVAAYASLPPEKEEDMESYMSLFGGQ